MNRTAGLAGATTAKLQSPEASTAFSRRQRGFTLVEVLVVCVLFVLLLLIVFSMTSTVSKAWSKAKSNVESFQAARSAFASITARLGTATLNTYFDYDPPQTNKVGDPAPPPPKRYIRKSELHFISGKALVSKQITHSIFFQTPLGSVDDRATYGGMADLLNACGYFVEFTSDADAAPPFLGEAKYTVPARMRNRLMEYVGSSEYLRVYNTLKSDRFDTLDWLLVTPAGTVDPPKAHVLAENVIAFAIIPKGPPLVPTNPTPNLLTTDYEYDSRLNATADPQPTNAHQLPPQVEVILVSIDENSAVRLQAQYGSAQPNYGFQYSDVFQKCAAYADVTASLNTIENGLRKGHIAFRTFRSDVSLQNSKWTQ